MIYLDTHVILWLFARKGDGLSVRAMKLIESDTELTISPMVLLELEYLHEVGRTTLGSNRFTAISTSALDCGYANTHSRM
jgi:PIN domain nuclease of toxin-antitoxin system